MLRKAARYPIYIGLLSGCAFPSQMSAASHEAIMDAIRAAELSAHNSWVLISAALVLMMTGPGLALFYGGLVRKKNVLGTMMHSFCLMAVASVLWAVIGYSLAFAEGSPLVGGLKYALLRDVGMEPNPTYAAGLPHLTFMAFQMMFAVITPALISGAFAERMKFSAMLLFMVLWLLVVYSPLAHMVWGSGGLLNAFSGGLIPCLDFAGGTVVHISSGVSALVCALVLGKRLGYPHEPIRPHNLPLSVAGACLLWIGWFGFNAGSALSSGGLAASAFVATQLGAASGALAWMLAEWAHNKKPSTLGAITGAVAGLVAITPAAGFVFPIHGLIIGAAAGLACYLMVAKAKARWGYDDSLDAFGVHGVGGTVGALLTGVFATRAVNAGLVDPSGAALPLGWIDGNAVQLLRQLFGVLVASALAAAGTAILLRLVDWLVGLRVDPEDEIRGLDLALHGEEAYSLES